MDSFELNKILGALLFSCLCLLSLNIAAGAVFAPHKPGKPGFEVAEQEPAAKGGGAQPAAPDEPIEKLLASAAVDKGESVGQEVRRLPHLRQRRAEPGRPEPLRRGRARAWLACRVQLFGRHEGQARQVDDRGPQRVPDQSEGLRSRHLDGLCAASRAAASGPT